MRAIIEPLPEAWLRRREARGRPVDALVMPDGALLAPDGKADAHTASAAPAETAA